MMIKINVNELKGTEILARHLLSESGNELISQGTVLKTEYIEKLKELGIPYVYIEEKEGSITVHEICEKTKEEVKNILETHIYKNTSDLQAVCKIADEIINEVINEEAVMEQVAAIKHTKGGDLYMHSVNVCTLSTVLAIKNGLKGEDIKEIAIGSLLHDIGLRYITAPYENTDTEEMNGINKSEYKKHSIYGYDAVKSENWLGDTAKDIILMHHERLDGSGYPLKNKGIKEPVQIVSVCDAFEGMTGGIGYRQRNNYEVIEYLRAYSDIKFNKKYVEQLMSIAAMYPVGVRVLLSTGEKGIVKDQNKGYIDRPIVNILDNNENIVGNVDLTKNLTIFINKVLD